MSIAKKFYTKEGFSTCFGCEACVQICPKNAIQMVEDQEGFRYPSVSDICIECGLCENICPYDNPPIRSKEEKFVFGGYHTDPAIRFDSTSGGAFSAIVETYCDKNYVIFGAKADGLNVYHSLTTDKNDISVFRKSKYTQSIIGNSYKQVKQLLKEGKKVLFSGTPCQIAGLKTFLGKCDQTKLLSIEVICEGVPSPLYVRKLDLHFFSKYGCHIESIDYRYTGKAFCQRGKWDFQQTRIVVEGTKKEIKKDRWFNPFWSVWLKHLMSRPSCYECPFTTRERVADITLGDLWGVHLYCPELYGKNGGSSLIVANTDKGKSVVKEAQNLMFGHELRFEDALRYQSPMRRSIGENPLRDACMEDLQNDMTYDEINKKWATPPNAKLLYQKYIWGNRQKILWWNLKQKFKHQR